MFLEIHIDRRRKNPYVYGLFRETFRDHGQVRHRTRGRVTGLSLGQLEALRDFILQGCPAGSGESCRVKDSREFGAVWAVLTATRPTPGQPVKELYCFEVPSSTEWSFQQIEPAFRPNVFVDISGTLDLKIRAMSCYETEARAFPHPRSPQALEALARRWGSAVGCPAAEAFELIRALR